MKINRRRDSVILIPKITESAARIRDAFLIEIEDFY